MSASRKRKAKAEGRKPASKPRGQRAAPRNLQADIRRRDAVALRLGARTYQEIGDALGISRQAAWELVDAAYEEVIEELRAGTERLIAEDVMRFERLLSSVWPIATGAITMLRYDKNGNEFVAAPADAALVQLSAVDRAVRILENRAKLLRLHDPAVTLILQQVNATVTREQALADGKVRATKLLSAVEQGGSR